MGKGGREEMEERERDREERTGEGIRLKERVHLATQKKPRNPLT